MGATAAGAGASIRPRWGYWPEIDGLRVVAVLSVFLFHLDRPLLPGGFVGVDIFFVISGFLIGSILLDDLARRQFSIARFYQRRIARIFPALILVVCVTFVAGWLLFSRHDLPSLAANSAYAALSLINFRLMRQDGYFEITPDSQPLLHYWSLAVEEQFYLVFPLFLYAIVRFTRRPLAIMLAVAAASFALCVFLTPTYPTMAFYLLPTRAWELLAGSALALYRSQGGQMPGRFGPAAAWAGFALILASVALIDEGNGFPGWIAAAPVAGTALILAAIGARRPRSLEWLALPWMVALGKRSYSLYLWHWPVFCFVDYHLLLSGDAVRAAIKIGLSFALALLCYRYVELPARRWLNRPDRFSFAVAWAVTAAAIVAVVGLQVRDRNLFETRPGTYAQGGLTVRGPGDRGVVVLVGDSQATMYGPVLESLARERRFTLHMLAAAGENFLPGAPGTRWPEVAGFINSAGPDLVILANFWSEKLPDPKPLHAALADIAPSSAKVILLAQPPFLEKGFGRATLRAGRRPPFAEPADMGQQRLAAKALLLGAEGPNVSVLDFSGVLTSPAHGIAVFGPDGRLTYLDNCHLTDSGTALVRPALARSVEAALAGR